MLVGDRAVLWLSAGLLLAAQGMPLWAILLLAATLALLNGLHAFALRPGPAAGAPPAPADTVTATIAHKAREE